MNVDKARIVLAELAELIGDHYSEAIHVLLDDHDALSHDHDAVVTRRNTRLGSRQVKILEYMSGVPGVPLTPGAVQAVLGLDHSPAPAMSNLALKGHLKRLGSSAIYIYPEYNIPEQREEQEAEEPVAAE